MIQISFTEDEISELKKEKDNNPFPKIRRRCYVLYLKSQSYAHKEIAKIIGISPQTVTDHLKLYQKGGIESLKTLNYKGQPSKLHGYKDEIKTSLEQNPVGTYKEAKARIKVITGIELSIPQVRYFLNQIGFNRRKVKQIPDKLDVEKQEEFKTETLEPLIEKAKNNEIHLFFVDAAHFVLRPFLGFLYCLTTLYVKTSAGRKRYNVLGALNAITKEITTFTNCSYINSFSVCQLMDRLKAKYIDLPVYLVMDNARYQNNNFVKAYAEMLDITLIFLPAYSPNLNLIERLWKFIKKKVLYSTYYKEFPDFTNAIDQCIHDTKGKYNDEIHSLLTLNFQTFKNAEIKP